MSIRSRIKGRIKKLAGANETAEPAEPPARREPPPRKPAPAPTPVAVKPAVAPAPAPPTNAVPEAADEPKVDDESKPVDEAKVARHRAKAQRGVLKHLHKEGGTMSMKDLHDYSERRWFIAHAGFSRMMEFFVEDRYVDFDHDSYTIVLTDDGRYFMKSPVN